jgi:AcrR family transcriptional regulator
LTAAPETLRRAPSQRDAHKARTKRALREAALKLFATQGFDSTTIEEVADHAGVSARTFFRYFPTKESVLFLGERQWLDTFADVYPAQARSLSDIRAMAVTISELAAPLARGRRSMQLYERAVASSAALRGREQDHRDEDVAMMATAIAARRGLAAVDEGCVLLASIGLMTYRRALDAWLNGPGGAELGDVIAEEFALLEAQVAGLGPAAHP